MNADVHATGLYSTIYRHGLQKKLHATTVGRAMSRFFDDSCGSYAIHGTVLILVAMMEGQ